MQSEFPVVETMIAQIQPPSLLALNRNVDLPNSYYPDVANSTYSGSPGKRKTLTDMMSGMN